jgi:hypothetical protein
MDLPPHLAVTVAIGAVIGLVSAARIYFDPGTGGKFNDWLLADAA